jgi:hypothetical protein
MGTERRPYFCSESHESLANEERPVPYTTNEKTAIWVTNNHLQKPDYELLEPARYDIDSS